MWKISVFLLLLYKETLPNGVMYIAVYNNLGTLKNSDEFIVPKDHFFFLGDNRDCSKDSRFLDLKLAM